MKMTLTEIGEFGLIRRIRTWMRSSDPRVVRGMGDDVAVIDLGKKALLVTTDILIEQIHFVRSWITPYHLGGKALAVNLSDIASMGGTPKYFLISLGLPKKTPYPFIVSFYRGLRNTAKRYAVELIGGDTSLSSRLVINICLLGEAIKDRLVYRNGASVGDDLWVSGTLGDSALALKMLQKKAVGKNPKEFLRRHFSPTPRLNVGQALAHLRLATSMIDVSDGLLNDTAHLLEESGVGGQIWENRIPLSRTYREHIHLFSRDLYRFASSGGEDYELLFTARPEMRRKILSLSRPLRTALTCIGTILPARDGFHVISGSGKRYTPSQRGFDHFIKKSMK